MGDENSRPIGVFDSGVGGLTVLRRIAERLPSESLAYLGDTARVPYGTKSPSTVERYALGCAKVLMRHNVKLMVVACNTASAYALESLRENLDVPVLGVIEPGARRAAATSKTGRIGIIGTAGTIGSGAYQNAIRQCAPGVSVFCKACPLFVPLAEEGWVDGPLPELAAQAYLDEIVRESIDTLLLGCTHYPLLREVITRVAGPGVALVDSAEAASQVVEETLDAMGLLASATVKPKRRFLVTDSPEGFLRTGRRFFGGEIGGVEWVDIH